MMQDAFIQYIDDQRAYWQRRYEACEPRGAKLASASGIVIAGAVSLSTLRQSNPAQVVDSQPFISSIQSVGIIFLLVSAIVAIASIIPIDRHGRFTSIYRTFPRLKGYDRAIDRISASKKPSDLSQSIDSASEFYSFYTKSCDDSVEIFVIKCKIIEILILKRSVTVRQLLSTVSFYALALGSLFALLPVL